MPDPHLPDDDGGPYEFSAQVGHLLRRAYQRHTTIFQQLIPDTQLTAAQFVALCAVRDQPGCSLSDVVKATVIDQATVRGVIERLRARRLVQVDRDRDDKRKVVVSLTRQGAALVQAMAPYAQRITESTFGPLNVAERVALVFLLRRMCEADPPVPAAEPAALRPAADQPQPAPPPPAAPARRRRR